MMRECLYSFSSALALSLAASVNAGDLYGINYANGDLYRISTVNAAVSLIGSTQIQGLGSLEFAPDGRLFAVSTGSSPSLYQINPSTAAATPIGSLNLDFVFEGGLAFAPNGTAYAVNSGNAGLPGLFTVNLTTGNATLVGVISGGNRDINGLGWRSDGMLVGLDDFSNSLLAIDPANAASSLIKHLTPAVGGVGGMALVSGEAYFNTAGPGGTVPGSDELYSFDPFTGNYTLVGSLAPTITADGISGLALAPTTSSVPDAGTTATLLGLGIIGFAWFRKVTGWVR